MQPQVDIETTGTKCAFPIPKPFPKSKRQRKSARKTWTNKREFELRLARSEKAFKMLLNSEFVKTLSFREQQKLKQQALLFALYKKPDKQPWKAKKKTSASEETQQTTTEEIATTFTSEEGSNQ